MIGDDDCSFRKALGFRRILQGYNTWYDVKRFSQLSVKNSLFIHAKQAFPNNGTDLLSLNKSQVNQESQ